MLSSVGCSSLLVLFCSKTSAGPASRPSAFIIAIDMEGVAVLSLVSSVITVTQFTAELTIATGKLIKSAGDALPEHEWIEEVAGQSRQLAEDLQNMSKDTGPLTKPDAAVAKLAERCLEESSAITALLQTMKVPLRSDGTKSKLRAARTACKVMLKRGDLQARHKKLGDLERQLAALLLYAIKRSDQEGFGELREMVDRQGRDCVTVVREAQTALVNKINALQNAMQAVQQQVARVAQHQLNALEKQKVEDLLSSLAYSGMKSRKEMIADPTGSSYDWAFEDSQQPTHQWLNSSISHCWISGEPGTGKSVFMKSLRLDRRTFSALQTHASGDKVLILDHYFWIAGGDLHERSLKAMLQHLCYQAIEQYDVLAKVAFPDEWQRGMSMRGLSWNPKSLLQALTRIISTPGFRTCIVIDGLDECAGREKQEMQERQDLIAILVGLPQKTDVKLCVSSRPWTEFENAFSDWPRLKLPENSAWDIFQLVCHRLQSANGDLFKDSRNDMRLFELSCAPKSSSFDEQYWNDLSALIPPKRLICDLCSKADGNLLWVTFVLSPVCERLAHGQSSTELKRYIADLPPQVEDYLYQLVYSRIHSTYKAEGKSECAMALTLAAETKDSHVRYFFMWMLQKSIQSGRGIAHDQGFATCLASVDDDVAECRAVHNTMRFFVETRCKDLMALSPATAHNPSLMPHGIDYQHRVIYDFLRSTKMRSKIDAHVPKHFKGPEFLLELEMLEFQIKVDKFAWDSSIRSLDRYADQLARGLENYSAATLWHADGTFNKPAVQACEDSARAASRRLVPHSFLRTRLDDHWHGWAYLILQLARYRHYGLIEDVVKLVYETETEFSDWKEIELFDKSMRGHNVRFLYTRCAVSEHELSARDNALTSSQPKSYYFPCKSTLWTELLREAQYFNDGHMSKSPTEEMRTRDKHNLSHAIQLFLEAGTSTKVELCVGNIFCHGPLCVCPDASTHSGLFECCEPHPESGHTHDWVEAKDVVLQILEIPESELIHKFPKSQGWGRSSHAELLEKAVKADSVWRKYVRECVANNGRPLKDIVAGP